MPIVALINWRVHRIGAYWALEQFVDAGGAGKNRRGNDDIAVRRLGRELLVKMVVGILLDLVFVRPI